MNYKCIGRTLEAIDFRVLNNHNNKEKWAL